MEISKHLIKVLKDEFYFTTTQGALRPKLKSM